jgi:hypothetical protein
MKVRNYIASRERGTERDEATADLAREESAPGGAT